MGAQIPYSADQRSNETNCVEYTYVAFTCMFSVIRSGCRPSALIYYVLRLYAEGLF